MEVKQCSIKDLWIIQPRVFEDARGYFFESWSERELEKQGLRFNFVQDNQSLSHKGVLRGLHFQSPPHAQGKLVRVIKGAVLDVAVDIRKNSPTYGKHFSIELNESNKTMFFIPPGFAHGFATLADNTIFSYKCTEYYSKESEGTILWNDKALGIDWQLENPIVSEKDHNGITFSSFQTPF
jgi:dTDP-4-dehydrorhamnose 3,5-epimerase